MRWRLVADVGGTNVRFARALNEDTVVDRWSYPVSHFQGFLNALRSYAVEIGASLSSCSEVAIGAAGPIHAGTAKFTNSPWVIRETDVIEQIGVPCTLVNDVEAAAYCLPGLALHEFALFGAAEPELESAHRLLAANIGTGFGAATLIKTPAGSWFSAPGEAGHMSLPFAGDEDARLRPGFPSVEHVLSGRGVVNLHAALKGQNATLSAPEIFSLAPSDPDCAATVRVFTRIAGDVLGNLTLGVAAWDGVFLFGSVAKGFAAVADHSAFREAFENKGPMGEIMKRVPVALVDKEDAALFGLAALPIQARL